MCSLQLGYFLFLQIFFLHVTFFCGLKLEKQSLTLSNGRGTACDTLAKKKENFILNQDNSSLRLFSENVLRSSLKDTHNFPNGGFELVDNEHNDQLLHNQHRPKTLLNKDISCMTRTWGLDKRRKSVDHFAKSTDSVQLNS